MTEPSLAGAARTGRPRKTKFHALINALRCLIRTGCEWRMLFKTIRDLALMLDRIGSGREGVPTAGVVDGQSVKARTADERGYDAYQRILGRKRHIAVDTDGRLLAMNLTPSSVADSTGAQMVSDALKKRRSWVKHLLDDAAHDRRTLMDKATFMDFTIEIVRKLEG